MNEERKHVLAWLRSGATIGGDDTVARAIAVAIERGDHLPKAPPAEPVSPGLPSASVHPPSTPAIPAYSNQPVDVPPHAFDVPPHANPPSSHNVPHDVHSTPKKPWYRKELRSMSQHDTMRWGDTQTLNLLAAAAYNGETGVFLASKQMLNAKWERPVVWRLMLSVSYNVVAADVGVTFAVPIFLQIGVGQASQLVPLASVLVVATVPPTVIPPLFFDIPAEAMQCQFFVGPVSTATPNAGDSARRPPTGPRGHAALDWYAPPRP